MTRKIKASLLLVCFAAAFCIGAVTQIDLTFQVKGILPIANGGTGSGSSGTVAAHNYFGNNTGSAAIPAFVRPVCADLSDASTGCSAAALNFADNETPTGTINGSNVTFILGHTVSPAASLNCYENGVHQIAGGADFTLATATITYGVAPPTGSSLICNYRY